jgi:hypothetical protein
MASAGPLSDGTGRILGCRWSAGWRTEGRCGIVGEDCRPGFAARCRGGLLSVLGRGPLLLQSPGLRQSRTDGSAAWSAGFTRLACRAGALRRREPVGHFHGWIVTLDLLVFAGVGPRMKWSGAVARQSAEAPAGQTRRSSLRRRQPSSQCGRSTGMKQAFSLPKTTFPACQSPSSHP